MKVKIEFLRENLSLRENRIAFFTNIKLSSIYLNLLKKPVPLGYNLNTRHFLISLF